MFTIGTLTSPLKVSFTPGYTCTHSENIDACSGYQNKEIGLVCVLFVSECLKIAALNFYKLKKK